MNLRKHDLQAIARLAMLEQGLEPEFPQEALHQLSAIPGPARDEGISLPELTDLPWCSIDNDDSHDLDQISSSERLPGGAIRLRVAVADVDALVADQTPLDLHARKNTTSVYTGVRLFPMLPERLCTDLTSLSEGEERIAIVIETTVAPDGKITDPRVFRARVRNRAKLTYRAVGAWLEGAGPLPEAAARFPGMDEQLRMQDEAAQNMRELRHEHGALELETIQPRPITKDGVVVDLEQQKKDRAGELIEDLMIAANGVTARFLVSKGFPTLRRVVRSPERWARIAELAAGLKDPLPADPDPKALAGFLVRQKVRDPLRFPDLSLTVVKLMGRGEYVLEMPGQSPTGHFGLAVRDYNHSTAPNRRYPDLITHRLLKAALSGRKPPYEADALGQLAAHCTQQENAADKVERRVRKSASAMFLENRIGEKFDALVTGASDKGTWVRILKPPVDGKVVQGSSGLDVGDLVKVKLIEVDVENGWIDFAAVGG